MNPIDTVRVASLPTKLLGIIIPSDMIIAPDTVKNKSKLNIIIKKYIGSVPLIVKQRTVANFKSLSARGSRNFPTSLNNIGK